MITIVVSPKWRMTIIEYGELLQDLQYDDFRKNSLQE